MPKSRSKQNFRPSLCIKQKFSIWNLVLKMKKMCRSQIAPKTSTRWLAGLDQPRSPTPTNLTTSPLRNGSSYRALPAPDSNHPPKSERSEMLNGLHPSIKPRLLGPWLSNLLLCLVRLFQSPWIRLLQLPRPTLRQLQQSIWNRLGRLRLWLFLRPFQLLLPFCPTWAHYNSMPSPYLKVRVWSGRGRGENHQSSLGFKCP